MGPWQSETLAGLDSARVRSEFHPELETKKVEAIFRKGMDPEIDSYSGFYDNHHEKSTGLAGYLKEKGVEELHFCGLAADICVHYSILDAVKEGFDVVLIKDATRALDEDDYEEAKQEWKEKGVKLVQS